MSIIFYKKDSKVIENRWREDDWGFVTIDNMNEDTNLAVLSTHIREAAKTSFSLNGRAIKRGAGGGGV